MTGSRWRKSKEAHVEPWPCPSRSAHLYLAQLCPLPSRAKGLQMPPRVMPYVAAVRSKRAEREGRGGDRGTREATGAGLGEPRRAPTGALRPWDGTQLSSGTSLTHSRDDPWAPPEVSGSAKRRRSVGRLRRGPLGRGRHGRAVRRVPRLANGGPVSRFFGLFLILVSLDQKHTSNSSPHPSGKDRGTENSERFHEG